MKPYLFLLLSTIAFSATAQQVEWQLIRDESGIQLYSTSVESSPVNKVRASVVIDVPLSDVVGALNDVDFYLRWVPYLQQAKRLTDDSPQGYLIYNYFDAPWPAHDRDYVYRVKLTQDAHSAIYRLHSEESELMPPQKHVVRAELIECQYQLTALNPQQTQVEIIYHIDPKGKLPLWVINAVNKRVPYNGLKHLRYLLETQSSAE